MLPLLYSLSLALALALATTLPLAWKWQLGVRRTAAVVALLSLVTAVPAQFASRSVAFPDSIPAQAVLNWILTLSAALALLLYRFYRDPEREIPTAPHVVISPADGEVLYVRESREGVLPVSVKTGRSYTLSELARTPLQMDEATVIGIGMNFLDIHVNRAPVAGRVAMTQRFPGLFGSLRRPEMVFQNERMTTVIEHEGLRVAVIQIASRLVRRIVSFVDVGQEVELGQRIGAIRFGSQVDLVLPRRADLTVTVKPGDRVIAGQSIVATFGRGTAAVR